MIKKELLFVTQDEFGTDVEIYSTETPGIVLIRRGYCRHSIYDIIDYINCRYLGEITLREDRLYEEEEFIISEIRKYLFNKNLKVILED